MPLPFTLFTGSQALAATIHRRAGDLVEPQPGVVVTGSWLTVKEQMADRYAAALADRGFTAVTVDFTGFGATGGEPRQAELPSRKADDLAAAARAVSSLSFVTPGGVGMVSVCASAQYALRAIAGGAPVAAFASVAGWFHDAESVAPFYGGPSGVAQRLDRGFAALEEYRRTGSVRTVPAYAAGDEEAGMFLEMDYYGSPERGAVPAWRNEMAELSWPYWLTYDGLSPAAAVSVPTVVVHSDDAVLPDNARAVAKAIRGPVELVWSEGTQTDFYDRDRQVGAAVDAVAARFGEVL